MTSVLFYWLSGKAFVLSLYKCDTTRMVGRLFFSTATHTILFNNKNLRALPCMHNQLLSLRPTLIFQDCQPLINPPHIYLHSLHLIYHLHIPTQPTSHLSPAYTYTAHISFIPHIYLHSPHLIYPPHRPTQPASHISTHIYLHCLHLTTLSHISTQPTSHPPYTYTACISFIPPDIPYSY